MSEQTTTERARRVPEPGEAPTLPGQIKQPNPIELFWEKNKRQIILTGVLVLAVFAGMRLWDYLQRLERNRIWGTFAERSGLASLYAPENASPWDYFSFNYQPYKEWGGTIASDEQLRQAASAGAGTTAASLARWLLAGQQARRGKEDAVKSTLGAIASEDPKDPGLVRRARPPIYVPEPEREPGAKTSKKELPPEPEAAANRDITREIAARMERFKTAHPELYEAPEPQEKPEIQFETTLGTFKVRLYSKRAPKHSAQFLANCREGFYDGLRFHEVRRRGTDPTTAATYEGDLAFLGDPNSKEEDRAKWGTFHSPKQTEREDSGVSHLPFVLAAERESEKTGSDQRLIYFTASDAAKARDGKNVVFGRVVDGMDVLESITHAPLSSTAEQSTGAGKPQQLIEVRKVTILE